MDKLGRCLAIQGRLGVGHARHRGNAACQCRRCAGADRLVLFAAWLTQMDVHVDETRTYDFARGIEDAISLCRGMRPHAQDVLATNPQVGNLINALRRVDDPDIGDTEDCHKRLFYAAGTSETPTPST